MSKWKCNDCDCQVDDFEIVWDHINGFSHTMSIVNPKRTIINVNIDSGMDITDDEYLFMANCTNVEFYNFFVWRER